MKRSNPNGGNTMSTIRTRVTGIAVGLCLLAVLSAQARIKLVALPERGATIIRLDNPQAPASKRSAS